MKSAFEPKYVFGTDVANSDPELSVRLYALNIALHPPLMSQRFVTPRSGCSADLLIESDRRIRAPSALRDRTALLGTPPSLSGRSSPFGPLYDEDNAGHRYADDLEGQNDEHLEGLQAKVKLLKDVSEYSTSETACNTHCRLDHYWDWQRGKRVDGSAQSDGAFPTQCTCYFKI